MLVSSPAAAAWATWPASARCYASSRSGNKYAGGQHRGIDVALGDAPSTRAPRLAKWGRSPARFPYRRRDAVTIATAGGYRLHLTYLGDLRVRRGEQADISEGRDAAGETPWASPSTRSVRARGSGSVPTRTTLAPPELHRGAPPTLHRHPAAPPVRQAAPVDWPIGRELSQSAPTAPQPPCRLGPWTERSASLSPRGESSALPDRTRRRRTLRCWGAAAGHGHRTSRRAAHEPAWGALGSRRTMTGGTPPTVCRVGRSPASRLAAGPQHATRRAAISWLGPY